MEPGQPYQFSPEPNKSNTVLIIVIIILVAIIAGGIGYFISQKSVQKEEPKEQANQEQVLDDKSETLDTNIETADWKIYKNEEYGFEMTLTDVLKGYRVVEKQNAESVSLRFEIPISSEYNNSGWWDLFLIAVYTKDGWEKIQKEEGPQPEFIAENDSYVFGYARGHDVPKDFTNVDIGFPKIISSFKLIK